MDKFTIKTNMPDRIYVADSNLEEVWVTYLVNKP